MSSPEKQRKSVVLLGQFNPPIYQPAWFSGQQLISKQDSDSAELNIIHPEVVNFKLSWCNIEVTTTRFVASTTQDQAFELIRDLIVGTFSLLAFTPIQMLGLNTEMHFMLRNVDEWHQFGNKLAPKETFWDTTLRNPGTRLVTIEGQRPDEYDGHVRVETGPSPMVQPGIFFRVNDHFITNDSSSTSGCSTIINILEKEWEASHARARNIINTALENR